MRAAATAVVLVIIGILADRLVLLQPAGAVLSGAELAALLALAVIGLATVAMGRSPALLATPLVAFAVFRLALGVAINVPGDAVIRDAQAGLAVMVVVLGQLLVVGIGLALARGRRVRHGVR